MTDYELTPSSVIDNPFGHPSFVIALRVYLGVLLLEFFTNPEFICR